jgi:YesN/AraC family two-component response regulator
MSEARMSVRPRVLLVDDETSSISLLMAYLKNQGLELLVAIGGNDGYRKALSGTPDLILMDVRMPDLDGFATCRKLRSDPRTASIPVIFLSASTDLQDKLEGFRVGASDYITKPFHQEEVLARVQIWLGIRQTGLSADTPQSAKRLAPSHEHAQDSRNEQQFERARSHIFAHLHEPLTVDGLTRELGINKERLTAIFRQHAGLTVFQYISEARLERAKHLLHTSDMQIQLLASRSGYRNAGDFSRAFKMRFGLSPKDFRHQIRFQRLSQIPNTSGEDPE